MIKRVLMASAALALSAALAQAQAWPSKPVRIIAPYPPGGGADTAARIIAQALTENTVYDAGGQLVSGSFMDYAIPRADLMPPMSVAHHPVACRTNPALRPVIG